MVKWVKLIDIASVLYGYPFEASLFTEDSNYIPLIRIRDVIPGVPSTYYKGEYQNQYIITKDDILVGMDGNFNLAKWKGIDGVLCQRVCKIDTIDGRIVLKNYLYHYLGPVFKTIEENTPGGSVKHLSAKIINSIEIPLPSIEEQQRIVNILDKFEVIVENVKKELELRQKQYEFYRKATFEHLECDWKKMRIVAKIRNGKDYKHLQSGTYPVWGTGGIMTYVDKYAYSNPSVLLPRKGSIENIYYTEEPFWTVDTLFYTEINSELMIPKFLFHYMTTINLASYNTSVGNRPSLTKTVLDDIDIPVPSLETQHQIVTQLDKYEAIIANLKRELELRKKQYEYYREKLLTFE